MLSQYTEQKDNLLNIYDRLINNQSEHIDSILKTQLLHKRDGLKNDEFILAVAGQMKAGKSTLLNAMIFGDDILPADDTELTAKITFITYDDQPSFEATLYTQAEFNEVRNSLKGTTDELAFNILLNESLQNLQDRGYSTYEELLNKKLIRGTDFKELINFVGKNGIFTPFVNTLTLKTNSKWVKNIRVVDTPGMNSPNKLRDKVVKEWIFKADAVIYCSYAGRAMDATDLTFIDEYMLHIPPNHRLIALTKADLINGEDKLINTMEGMIGSDWNLKKNLIPSVTSIFPVCQMAVLLDKMNNSNIHFSERMEEEYENYDLKDIFENSNRQFCKLERAIEDKLIANKDQNIIEANQQYLTSIFDNKLLELKEKIDESEKSFELINANQGELVKKQSEIQNDIKSISENLELISISIKLLHNKNVDSIKITQGFLDVQRKIDQKLQGLDFNELDNKSSGVVNEYMTNYLYELKEQADKFSVDFSKGLQKLFNQPELDFEYINIELLKVSIAIKCTTLIDLHISSLQYDIRKAASGLKQLYRENVGWWGRTFNSDKTKVNKSIEEFIKQTLEPILTVLEKQEQHLKVNLNRDVDDIIRKIENTNRKILSDKLSQIEELKKTSNSELGSQKENEIEKLHKLNERKLNLEIIMEDVKNTLNTEKIWEAKV